MPDAAHRVVTPRVRKDAGIRDIIALGRGSRHKKDEAVADRIEVTHVRPTARSRSDDRRLLERRPTRVCLRN
jgi:hypothetical protein